MCLYDTMSQSLTDTYIDTPVGLRLPMKPHSLSADQLEMYTQRSLQCRLAVAMACPRQAERGGKVIENFV